MSGKKITIALGVAFALVAGIAYANLVNPRENEITIFYAGHTHTHDGETIGSPQHSGGTDKYGCHNASVPYHCH